MSAAADLHAIANAWPYLLNALEGGRRVAPDGMPKPAHRERTLPIDEGVSQIIADVTKWARVLGGVLQADGVLEHRTDVVIPFRPVTRTRRWRTDTGDTAELLRKLAAHVPYFESHVDPNVQAWIGSSLDVRVRVTGAARAGENTPPKVALTPDRAAGLKRVQSQTGARRLLAAIGGAS